MASITIGATKLKIPSDHAKDFSTYLDLTCGNITETLNKKGYKLDVLNKLRPNDFSNAEMLPFRLINDNREISLDRSFELKLNNNNELYAVFNLGAVKLATLSTSASLIDVIKHLKHFNFEEAGNFRNYRAGVDVSGNTLPKKFAYSSSISDDVTKYLESLVKENLRTNIFGAQDITLSITRKVTESLTEKFVSEPFSFPKIEEEVVVQNTTSNLVNEVIKQNTTASNTTSNLVEEVIDPNTTTSNTTFKLLNKTVDEEFVAQDTTASNTTSNLLNKTVDKEFVVQNTTALNTTSNLLNKTVDKEFVVQNTTALNTTSNLLNKTVDEEFVVQNTTALNITSNLLNKTVVEEFVAQDTKALNTPFTAANENQEKEEWSKVQTSSFGNSASDNSFDISPMIILGTVVGAGLGAFMLCARNNHGHGQMVPYQAGAAMAALNVVLNPIMNLIGHYGRGDPNDGLPLYQDPREVGGDRRRVVIDSPVQEFNRDDLDPQTPPRQNVVNYPQSPNFNQYLGTVAKSAKKLKINNNDLLLQVEAFCAKFKSTDLNTNQWLHGDDGQLNQHFHVLIETIYAHLLEGQVRQGVVIQNVLKEAQNMAVEYSKFQTFVLKNSKWGAEAKARNLQLDKINFEGYMGFFDDIFRLAKTENNPKLAYILYLGIMLSIPVVNARELNDEFSKFDNSTLTEDYFDDSDDHDGSSVKEENEESEDAQDLLPENALSLNLVEPKGLWADVMSELGDLASYTAASGMANVLLMQLLNNPYTGPVAQVLSDMDLYLLKLEMAEVYHNGILQFLNTDSDTHHLRGSNSHNDVNE